MPDPSLSPEKHLRWCFPTPVLVESWTGCEAHTRDLHATILEAQASGNRHFGHIEGGWSSAKDFFSWDTEAVRALEAHVQGLLSAAVAWTAQRPFDTVRDYDLQARANVLRDGGYHAPHSHPNSFWSGVYYVSIGKTHGGGRRNGCLELIDPRSATGAIGMEGSRITGECVITPEPGLTVIFPGWMKHLVHPFHGTGERISVAFNLDRE